MKSKPQKSKSGARKTAAEAALLKTNTILSNKAAGPNFAPARRHDLLMREEDGKIYLVSSTSKRFYFVIDGVAADVWRALDGLTTVSDHIDAISEKFHSLPRAKVRRDVVSFVTELKKHGLVE